MNRKVALGVLFFFALVAVALMGGDKAAVAGHGCHGCAGVVVAGDCDGAPRCQGLRLRRAPACCGEEVAPVCHGRVACHGVRLHRAPRCCGPAVTCGCEGSAVPAAAPEAAPEKVPEAPKAEAAKEARLHAPMSFFQVSFRQ